MEFGSSVVAGWSGVEPARSDDTVIVEGNHYFPKETVNSGHLTERDRTMACFWKGVSVN